jgi:hypothetical protein
MTPRILALSLLLFALAPAKTLLLLPVSGETSRTEDISAINRLFLDALGSDYAGSVTEATDRSGCAERACALEAAQAAGADEVAYSSLHKLGGRWIFSATIVGADGSAAFNQRLTAASIEDMEAVTRRMADALVNRATVEKAASVDNITRRENEQEPDRRRSLHTGGIALGYLFPVGNSFGYTTQSDYFGDPYTRHDYSQLIRLTWLNNWEFRDNMMLGVEGVWTMPHAIGLDFNLRYLLGRGDYSPFVGGGLGLHYVRGDDDAPSDKRNSGPALNAQAGMLLFRTYDVNLMLRGQYQVIFNSDVDQGVAVDVGVSIGNKDGEKPSREERHSAWAYVGVAALTLLLIGAAAN